MTKTPGMSKNELQIEIKKLREKLYELENVYNHLDNTGSFSGHEEKFLESEKKCEKYRSLVETSSDWIWEVDANGFYTYVSPKVFDLTGYMPEEIIGKSPFDLMPEDEKKRIAEHFLYMVRHKLPIKELVNLIIKKDGNPILLETNGEPVLDADGTCLGYRGVDRDITERMRSEIALRESEENYRLLVETMNDGIGCLDENGTFTFVNSRFEKMLLYSRDELIGRNVTEFFDDENREILENQLSQRSKGEDLNYEIEWIRKDGSKFPAIVSPYPIFKDGEYKGSLGVITDISEWKKTKEELARSEQKFQNIINASPMGIHMYDLVPDGRLLFSGANKAADKILSIEHNELIGKTIEDAFPTLQKTKVPKAYKKVAKDGMTWKTEQVNYNRGELARAFDVEAFQTEPNKIVSLFTDITEKKRAEEEHLRYLSFLENTERINQVIKITDDLDEMMEKLLNACLTIFESDRAWLLYPCDLETENCRVPMECTRKEFPGAFNKNSEFEINDLSVQIFRLALENDGPVSFDCQSEIPLSKEVLKKFDIHSKLVMAIYPKIGKPWLFGMHQCSGPRVWTGHDISLFKEIGRKLTDALSSLLFLKDLKQSEQSLRTIFETSPTAMIVSTLGESNCLDVNKAYCEIFGYSREDVIGLTPTDIGLASEEFERLRSEFKKHGQVDRIETRQQAKDGSMRSILLSSRVIILDNEECAITSVLDISEQKKAEQALEKEKDFNSILVSFSPAFFVAIDKDGRTIMMNPSMMDALGYIEEEVMGKEYLLNFVPKREHEILSSAFESMTIKKKPVVITNHVITKNGKERLVEWHGNPILNAEGEFDFFFGTGIDITERKQAEESIRKSEEKYRGIFDESVAAIFVFDQNKNFIDSNQAGLDLLGYSRDELLKKNISDVDADPDVAQQAHEPLLSGDRLTNYEHRLKRKDGTIVTVLNNSRPLLDINKEVIGMQSSLIDITQRKKMEEELRISEEKFSKAFHSGPNIMAISSLKDGKYLDINESFTRILGYARDEVIGRTSKQIQIFSNHDDRERLAGLLRINGNIFNEKANILTKNGEELNGEFSAQIINIKGERCLLAVVNDITERRKTEKELVRLRNLLGNIVNSMPSVLVGVATDGRVTQWNKEAERVTGITAKKAHGRYLQNVFPLMASKMEKVSEAIIKRETVEDTKIGNVVNGETRFSDITVFPLINNGIEGAVIRVDDVTEKVRIEEMMIQSEKMLSVGGLAAGMAHEINNPLAGIMQNVQVIRNRLSPDFKKNIETAKECGTQIGIIQDYMKSREIIPMIEMALESGSRAAKIVENMLSFSRKAESRFTPCKMGLLLDKTIELVSNDYDLKKKYDFKQIKIIREYDPATPMVLCESTNIQQVFLNIIKNGAEAMSEMAGGQKLCCFTLRTKKNKKMEWSE